jgi:hypothetical protein
MRSSSGHWLMALLRCDYAFRHRAKAESYGVLPGGQHGACRLRKPRPHPSRSSENQTSGCERLNGHRLFLLGLLLFDVGRKSRRPYLDAESVELSGEFMPEVGIAEFDWLDILPVGKLPH